MNLVCKHNLTELQNLLKKITPEAYIRRLDILSNAAIGQHIRHILEFYSCVFSGLNINRVNYDARPRDPELENIPLAADQRITGLLSLLDANSSDKELMLEGNFTLLSDETACIRTTLYRELAFCFDHAIHHQAMIKVGLKELQLDHLIVSDFGVGIATLKHKTKCVQ